MELINKTAVVYGAGGALGGAIASAFARAGAKVFLAGRKTEPLQKVLDLILKNGGNAELASVDSLDKDAVDDHLDSIITREGKIDICVNAIGIYHVQGIPLTELSPEDFNLPITTYINSNFITSTAAARHMMKQKSGTIFTISTPGALLANGIAGGFGVACAAVEGLTRQLAGELGAYGIRVICLRPDAIPEASYAGSHSFDVFSYRAKLLAISLDELFKRMSAGVLLPNAPTLADVANTAVFLASDKAKALTATVANLSCGSVVG